MDGLTRKQTQNKAAAHRRMRPTLKDMFEGGSLPPFIGWDGEGDDQRQQNMILFGCSADTPITGEKLRTVDMLAYMINIKQKFPDAIHVSFYFDWDVNVILCDLSPYARRNLIRYGSCYYRGYIIEHIPRKMFIVTPHSATSRYNTSKLKPITIYDISSFFNCSYLQALDTFEIGTEDEINVIISGKSGRGGFTYGDIQRVRSYWTKEISLLPCLADSIRDTCYNSGFYISKWYGPGAIADYMLTKNGAKNHLSKHNSVKIPAAVKYARKVAYGGGRFSLFLAGVYYGPVYVADLNSAYVAAMRHLPSLANGEWRRRNPRDARGDIHDFGLYHIIYDKPAGATAKEEFATNLPNPLFRRTPHSLDWPRQVDGWYWGPEAKLVVEDPSATFTEAWEWSNERPVFQWVDSMYRKRMNLKQEPYDPAEKTYKWGLAAMYGLCARRVGWNHSTHTAPSSHQLEWAGFITSWCRAQMQQLATTIATMDGNGLVSIDTDGITSLVPFPSHLEVGEGLGQWGVEEYHGLVQWQNGVYWLLESDGTWIQKSRGLPRGTIPRQAAIDAVKAMEQRVSMIRYGQMIKKSGDTLRWANQAGHLVNKRRAFAGYRTAMQGFKEERWRTWEETEYIMAFGSGRHLIPYCPKCNGEDVPMHTIRDIDPRCFSEMSEPHKLPWEDEDIVYDDPMIALEYDYEDPEYHNTVIFPQREIEGGW